jgi:PAS domain S-box-containing protein
MRILDWIYRHTVAYWLFSVLFALLAALFVAWLVNNNIDGEREVPLTEALANYGSTVESGTVNSRAMGAAILFGLENLEAKQLAMERLPPNAPKVLSALTNLRTLYFSDAAFLVNREGVVAAYSSQDDTQGAGVDLSFRPYVQLAMQGTPNVYPAVDSIVNKRGIFLAAPVRAGLDNASSPVGTVVVEVSADKLDALLKSWGGPAMLVSPQGLVFASNRKDFLFNTTSDVSGEQVDRIRNARQFGKIFGHEQPRSLPFTLNTPETRVDGVRYIVRSHPLEWDDPDGDWMLVLLDKRNFWWSRWDVLGLAALFGLVAAMASFWLYTLARNAVLQQDIHRQQHIAATTFESQEGIVITDANNVILRVNRSFVNITGYSADEVIGRSTTMFNSGRHDADFYAAMWDTLNSNGSWEGDIWNRRKNGEVYPAHLIITAVKDKEDGSLTNYVATYSDITARVSAEEKLLDSLRKLEEKERAKTRFLAAAGHDLRQPIAAATLFLEALKFTSQTRQQSELTERIDHSMRTFSSLLDRLLDISKFDAGLVKPQLSTFNLAELFHWLEQTFDQPALNRQLRLRLYFPMKKTLAVHTDIGLVQSVLMNLVSNAIKFTARGSILISARVRGNRVLLQVWDTGIGIAEADIHNIFDEFYQVANPQRSREAGLGLGLSICQRTLALLGGEIACRSRPGRGSVFEFSLPLSDEQLGVMPLPAGNAPDKAADAMLVRGKRVVVVEDDALVAAGLVKLLYGLGAEVWHFQTAEDALQLQHTDLAATDIFLVDYSLGSGLNGIQFLEAVQQKQSSPIHAVVITGETSSKFINSVLNSPWPVLHKPITYAKVASSLKVQSTVKSFTASTGTNDVEEFDSDIWHPLSGTRKKFPG